MLELCHNISLIHDNFFLFVLENEFLIDNLHGVEFSIFLKPAQKNLRKSSCTDALQNIKRVQGNPMLFDLEDRFEGDLCPIQEFKRFIFEGEKIVK